MNINDIMLQGDAGSGTTEASSKYYNVGKNKAAIADPGFLLSAGLKKTATAPICPNSAKRRFGRRFCNEFVNF